MSVSPALRLSVDGAALVANWRRLAEHGGMAACGAAVKADGYGLGAEAVARRLVAAGCRDLFVSSWAEAEALGPVDGAALSVLHGVRAADMGVATASSARPVVNSPEQAARWRAAGNERACDVMIDTGINRLGIAPADIGCLDGLRIATLMSHLATAEDADTRTAERQRADFAAIAARVPHERLSLANSAGVFLGLAFAFDLTRPGIALYGGVPRPEAAGAIRPVVRIEAEVLQVRAVPAGGAVGYGATWVAARPSRIAVLNLGYADGYARALSNAGTMYAGDVALPVVGRVSMDVIAVDATDADVREGDWLAADPDLAATARAAGVSQYELLTGLGHRYQRRWT